MPTVSKGLFSWLFRGAPVLEDFADRLNHVWTVGLLLLLACIISWNQQLFNNPISCWTPAEFTDAMVRYTHTTCWNSDYHYSAFIQDDLPVFSQRVPVGMIYKWLPLILCIQALLFKFPNILMYTLHGYSGISFEKVASITYGHQNLNLEERAALGKQTGRYMYNWCSQWGSCLPWRLLSILWLLVKSLFFANVLIQFLLVDKLISTRNPPFDNSTSYGDTIFANLFNKSNTEWKTSPIFPRAVMCVYQIRRLRNVEDYSVQCELPINEFNEYVYMFIWIWLLIVVVISFLSLVVWVLLTLVPILRQRYISKMLKLSEDPNTSNTTGSQQLAGLVGEDGVMVLKLISSNSSELFVRDVVSSMHQLAQRQAPYSYAPVMTQPSAPSASLPPASAPAHAYPVLTTDVAPAKV